MKKALFFGFILFFIPLSFSFSQERQERNRGFYIDTGLGFGGISYFNGDIKEWADDFSESADIRMTMDYIYLTIGWGITQDFYIVGSLSGIGDAYFSMKSNEFNHNQISIPMFGIGVRFYPLPNKKYLQIGFDLGASRMGLYYENKMYSSDFGLSGKISAAYDFDSSMTGITPLLGGSLMLNIIENGMSLSYDLFFKLAFK